jgi:MFS family permease
MNPERESEEELQEPTASTVGESELSTHDPYAALRVRDFRLYIVGNFLSITGLYMQTTAVLWEIHRRTASDLSLGQSALPLGLVGLVQVLPVISLALLSGHVADRFNRRYVIMTALLVIVFSSTGLAFVSSSRNSPTALIYGCLFFAGVARAFQQPAKSSLMPQLVPRADFPNAVTWNSAAFQMAAVMGPALAGGLIAIFHSATAVFVFDVVAALMFFTVLSQIHYQRPAREHHSLSIENLAAGARFVWHNKIILAASGLDMFAVLLGGAVALLPIYAKEILQVGDFGYGCMQAAPAAGAVVTSFIISHRRPMQRAGLSLLLAVAGFGVVTIVFGISRSFPLSLAMLALAGALDNVSVVVRHSLVQLLTPDEMRGRVSAINGMFISISNELGGFESGTAAWLFSSPTLSVVSGGMGTLVVVTIVAWLFPQLRHYGQLDSSG